MVLRLVCCHYLVVWNNNNVWFRHEDLEETVEKTTPAMIKNFKILSVLTSKNQSSKDYKFSIFD